MIIRQVPTEQVRAWVWRGKEASETAGDWMSVIKGFHVWLFNAQLLNAHPELPKGCCNVPICSNYY